MIYTSNGLMMTLHSIIPITFLTEYSHVKIVETTSIAFLEDSVMPKYIFGWSRALIPIWVYHPPTYKKGCKRLCLNYTLLTYFSSSGN
jgi:hypothetical protein